MSIFTSANHQVRYRCVASRLVCAAFLVSLVLGAVPVRAGMPPNASLARGTLAQDGPNPSILQPDAMDDSGLGFKTPNFLPFITANVMANDSDPNGLPIFVQSFDTTGLKGQAQYLYPGTLDTSFGVQGKATTKFEQSGMGWALLQQPDGKLVLVGKASLSGPGLVSALARYFPDGSLDPSFGSQGKVTTIFPNGGDTGGAALQPDGKIVTSSTSNNQFAIARYNSNGSLDTAFGSSGFAYASFGDNMLPAAPGVGIQPGTGGKIVAAATLYDINFTIGKIAAARFNPDGSLDTTFGTNGLVTTQFSPTSMDEVMDMLIQPDGKIVVAGDTDANIALVRYNPDGSLDSSFGTGGLVSTDTHHSTVGPAITLMSDGRIVLALENTGGLMVARYNSNGTLDASFGGTGVFTTYVPSCIGGSKPGLALQPDSKIIVAAACLPAIAISTSPQPDKVQTAFTILRYNADGSLDSSFGTGGMAKTEFPGLDGLAAPHSVVLQPDGRIVAAGESDDGFTMTRYFQGGTFAYNPNGQFDSLLPGETAFDPFTYTLSNGVLTDTATVTITVTGGYKLFLPTEIRP